MATVANLLVRIDVDVADLTKNLTNASKKFDKLGKSLTDTGKNLTRKVTAPILALGTGIVAAGVRFDDSMARVSAVSGAVGTDFERLRNQAKDLGATTQFSASQAAEGMEFLARAGFEVDDIYSALPGVLDLAAASGTDLGRAADITSDIMSGFGIAATEAGHVADVLAKASASANTDVEGMGVAMSFAAPTAADLGISIEEATAAVGLFSDAGVKGSRAGTALRGGLSRLIKPTKEMDKVMNDLNLEFFTAEGNFVGIKGVLKELEKGTKDLTQEQRSQALTTLFGQEAMSGWSALLGRGSDELEDLTKKLENSDGAAKDMAKTMMKTLGGAFRELLSVAEAVAIEFADVMTPTLDKLADQAKNVLGEFKSLDKGTKKFIIVVLGLLAGLGPVILAAAGLVTAFSKLAGAIKILMPFVVGISPAMIATVAAYAAVIAAGLLLIKNWDKVKKFIDTKLRPRFESFVTFVKGIPEKIKKFWEDLPFTIGFILGEFYLTAKTEFEKTRDEAIAIFADLPDKIAAFFADIGPKASEAIKTAIPKMKTAVNDFFTKGIQKPQRRFPPPISTPIKKEAKEVKSLGTRLKEAAFSIGSKFLSGFKKGAQMRSPSAVERAFMAMRMSAIETIDTFDRLAPQFRNATKKLLRPVSPMGMRGVTMATTATTGAGIGISPTPQAAAAEIGAAAAEAGGMAAGGVSIQVGQLVVREEADIEKIAQRLFVLQQSRLRAQGGRI